MKPLALALLLTTVPTIASATCTGTSKIEATYTIAGKSEFFAAGDEIGGLAYVIVNKNDDTAKVCTAADECFPSVVQKNGKPFKTIDLSKCSPSGETTETAAMRRTDIEMIDEDARKALFAAASIMQGIVYPSPVEVVIDDDDHAHLKEGNRVVAEVKGVEPCVYDVISEAFNNFTARVYFNQLTGSYRTMGRDITFNGAGQPFCRMNVPGMPEGLSCLYQLRLRSVNVDRMINNVQYLLKNGCAKNVHDGSEPY